MNRRLSLSNRIARKVERDLLDVEAALMALRSAIDRDPDGEHVDEQRRVLEAGLALDEKTLRSDRLFPFVLWPIALASFVVSVAFLAPARVWFLFALWGVASATHGAVFARWQLRREQTRARIAFARESLRRFER